MMRPVSVTIVTLLFLVGCHKDTDTPPKEIFEPITLETSEKQIIITEQASASVMIFDQPSRKRLWSWSADDDPAIPATRKKWFRLPDEAQPVDDCRSLLITASGGGVALVRIEDSKVLFYAHPGGNPHSAEMLPDGSIVVASSTGCRLSVYRYDPLNEYVPSKLSETVLDDAHACVWDNSRKCLWAAGGGSLVCYGYQDGSLTEIARYGIPSAYAHDLSPVYGEDRLILSTGSNVYFFDPDKKTFSQVEGAASVNNVKSISTGPKNLTTLCTIPDESWHTTQVLGFFTGMRAFYLADSEIYKARWRVNYNF